MKSLYSVELEESVLVDFTFCLCVFCLFWLAVPLTHLAGLIAHHPRENLPGGRPSFSSLLRHVLFYSVRGGRYHSILQGVSWLLFSCSGLLMLPMLVWKEPEAGELYHDLLPRCGAIGAVFSELFMIKSLLTFDPLPEEGPTGYGETAMDASAALMPLSPRYTRTHLPSRSTSAVAVIGMGLLWLANAWGLLVATEYIRDPTTKQVYYLFAALSLCCGALTTHGIGGKLLQGRKTEEAFARDTGWRFFQPFEGGTAFVTVQALGWASFSAALLALFWLAQQAAAGVAAYAYYTLHISVAAGTVMTAAQLLLASSVFYYQLKEAKQTVRTLTPRTALRALQRAGAVWLPILIMYTPMHVFLSALSLTYLALPATVATALWLGCGLLYVLLTGIGEPEHTGWREWPAFKVWLQECLPLALNAWMGKVEVVHEGDAPLTSKGRYVMGYVPHGLFPIGAPYLALLPDFRRLFPDFEPVSLIASVCFFTPIIRDFCSWCGVRQVSKRTFLRALEERGAVMLVPGGQAELVHSWRFQARRQFVVHTRHKGFVRLALQQRAALVPVLCLGEVGTLGNLVDLPRLQAWSYKKLGFPIPYLLVGRWGVTPFPRATPLRFVVGRALPVPHLREGEEVSDELVEDFQRQFYGEVQRLFEKHQPTFPGYEDVSLVLSET